MHYTCKNCNQQFKGNYCNFCGQAANTERLNAHFLWHDIQHGFFHFDNGILYTAKELFTRPGHSIREFIEGKRVKHFKPLSLVIVLSTVYGLLFHYFHVDLGFNIKITGVNNPMEYVEKINEWMVNHFALTTLGTVPFYAIGSFVAFRKQGYNFIEHCILNSFLAAQRLILHIAFFPLIYFLDKKGDNDSIVKLLTLAGFVLMVWGYSQFFNKLGKIKVTLLTGLSYLVGGLCILLAGITIAITFILIMGESLKH